MVNSMVNAIEIKNLCKKYDKFSLKNISFTLPTGYIMGLIGPNGAGKTTTIKLMLNMIHKTSGSVKVLGLDSISGQNEIKECLGCVFDSSYFVEEWTAKEINRYVGTFYKKWDSKKFDSMLQRFSIDAEKSVKKLSRGMQMKLMLACAFSHDAKLLILDEPTSGLDPVARDELLELLSEFIEDGERSVLFSTHITTDLDKIADYITFVNNGSLLYTGTKDEFLNSFRIVKGGRNELSQEQEHRIIGLRKYSTGFEGLIRIEDLRVFSNFTCDAVSIDDIIVFTNKGESKHE